MPPNAIDAHPFWQLALALATQAMHTSNPNPRVGCVIVDAHGHIIGQGHTQPRGGAHAEVMALRDAAHRGHSCAGSTVYVTLEPCSHHGRTPPCCDALIAAGVAQVHVALPDPNPLVAGRGLARLRAAGVAVHAAPADIAQAAWELNLGFFSRMQRKRPWVRLKTAISLDGRTALANGHSQWITGEAARTDVQQWRARACAIATGVGTVLADDPLLNVRLDGLLRQPMLVVLDSQLRTPVDARLWSVPQRRICIATVAPPASPPDTRPDITAPPNWHTRQQALRAQGAQILELPVAPASASLHSAKHTPPIPQYTLDTSENHGIPHHILPDAIPSASLSAAPAAHADTRLDMPSGTAAQVLPHIAAHRAQPDLAQLLHALAEAEVNELHIEAGPTLAGAWLQAGLVDEVLAYIAPRLLGDGLPLAHLPVLQQVDAAPRWALHSTATLDGDLRLQLRQGHYWQQPQVQWCDG